MIEKMNPLFIRIPNVLMYDEKIVPSAKYLYGVIDMLSYYTESITNDELKVISQISHNSIEKYLKQLQEHNYIRIERKKNARKITPLIEKSVEIYQKKVKQAEIDIKEKEKLKIEHEEIKKNIPDYVKDFIKNVK